MWTTDTFSEKLAKLSVLSGQGCHFSCFSGFLDFLSIPCEHEVNLSLFSIITVTFRAL